MGMTPIWFGPSDRPLFGWFHVPNTSRARAGAVLCAPIGRENIQAHYALRLTAEALADHEIAVLRFDYDGMGDSAGVQGDPDRVGAWLRSTSAAIDVVRSSGVDRVSLVGMRMGALLASRAAADDHRIDQLVLWDPCRSGASFLREQEAVSALGLGVSTKRPDGSVETPGLVYTAETVQELHELRLEPRGGPGARRVLVLTRSGRDEVMQRVEELGSESVQYGEAAGQDALLDVGPPFQKLPFNTIRRVAEWTSEGYDEVAGSVRLPSTAEEAVVDRAACGDPIVERAVALPPVGLFGILTELRGNINDGPVAVLLSVANEHHIGPDRLWVDLSRRWARRGMRSLRVDLSGLGDSPVRGAGQEQFVVWAKQSFDDVADIAQAIAPQDRRQVVLIGLCASAYQAIDSAFDVRPAGVVAVNPVLSFVPPELSDGSPVDPRRRAALPRNALVNVFHDNGPLSVLRRRFPNLGWWVRLRARPNRSPSAWLTDLVDGGSDVLIVAGEREARPIRLGAGKRRLRRLSSTGRFRFEYIPDLEHGLLISSQRELVADLISDHLFDRFAGSEVVASDGPADVPLA